MALTYVALKRLKVGENDRLPGELVPEASEWRNVHNYISAGYIAVVNEEPPVAIPVAPKKTAPAKAEKAEF